MEPSFNILYYSRFCEHSNKVLEHLAKNALLQDLNCICVDRRTTNEHGQTVVQLENGKQEALPPMIDRVPALLLVKEKYQIRYGNDILAFFKGTSKGVAEKGTSKAGGNKEVEDEPAAFENASFSSSFSAY